jgi:hypothetical protein
MWIVNFPASHPFWFWLVAIVWATYQAMAGYQYGLYIFNSHRHDERQMVFVRRWFYGVQHSAFYFICTIAGFIAWMLAGKIGATISNWSDVATGTVAILVALALLATVGVAGILPRILYLGNRPV